MSRNSSFMNRNNSPVRISLTGGTGSGKSTALAFFSGLGAACLDSDKVVHRLLERPDVRRLVAESLGLDGLPVGEPGRRRLAEVVFGDRARLTALEKVLFPLVREEIRAWFDQNEVKQAPAAVVEIPLLFEAGMEDLFDRVVLITAPRELRRRRQSGRMEPADFESRVARQMPEAGKRRRADTVFENEGPPARLEEFIREFMAVLKRPDQR